MVELEDDRIGFATIGTRMCEEVVDEELGAFGGHPARTSRCAVDVLLTVGGVVLLLVGGSTRTAVAIE